MTQPVYTCDDQPFRRLTGFRQQFDLKAGMEQTVNWYRMRGML